MKKYILFPVVLVALVLSSNMVKAQAEDVSNPLLQYINKDKGIRFTAGARLFADVAYYHSEYTPMKSGAAHGCSHTDVVDIRTVVFLR